MTNNTWQCFCHCWSREEHADRVHYLADTALKMESKWSVVATDLLTGQVVGGSGHMHSEEAWGYFDYLRGKHLECKPICRGGYHFCVDVAIAFNGRVEKSSIWS